MHAHWDSYVVKIEEEFNKRYQVYFLNIKIKSVWPDFVKLSYLSCSKLSAVSVCSVSPCVCAVSVTMSPLRWSWLHYPTRSWWPWPSARLYLLTFCVLSHFCHGLLDQIMQARPFSFYLCLTFQLKHVLGCSVWAVPPWHFVMAVCFALFGFQYAI